ncbi:dehydrogenase [Ktedonobacteria bacterium brp13]|nr:dehydrogenase [Ktedonobacteria bacterium brp13]
MRAVMITEPAIAEVVERERPVIGVDEVLVRSRVVGLCESDVELYQGKRPEGYYRYPIVPGHEWSGEVIESGALVHHVVPGDRVVVESVVYCGLCRNCRHGLTNLCSAGYEELGFSRHGGLGEYVAVPARLVHALPAETSFEEAALLEPVARVAHLFLNTQPLPGAVVTIVGDGVESLIAVQIANFFHPHAIVLLGFRDERLQLARQLGATHAFNMSRVDTQAEILKISDGRGADIVFEGTGHIQAMEEAFLTACRGGTVLLEGLTSSTAPLSVSCDIFVLKQLKIQGSFGANAAAWEYAIRLFTDGQLQLAPLISHRFPLDEYQEALDTLVLRMSRALKVLITHE